MEFSRSKYSSAIISAPAKVLRLNVPIGNLLRWKKREETSGGIALQHSSPLECIRWRGHRLIYTANLLKGLPELLAGRNLFLQRLQSLNVYRPTKRWQMPPAPLRLGRNGGLSRPTSSSDPRRTVCPLARHRRDFILKQIRPGRPSGTDSSR